MIKVGQKWSSAFPVGNNTTYTITGYGTASPNSRVESWVGGIPGGTPQQIINIRLTEVVVRTFKDGAVVKTETFTAQQIADANSKWGTVATVQGTVVPRPTFDVEVTAKGKKMVINRQADGSYKADPEVHATDKTVKKTAQ